METQSDTEHQATAPAAAPQNKGTTTKNPDKPAMTNSEILKLLSSHGARHTQPNFYHLPELNVQLAIALLKLPHRLRVNGVKVTELADALRAGTLKPGQHIEITDGVLTVGRNVLKACTATGRPLKKATVTLRPAEHA